jgi:hypothetical protein
LMGEILQTFPDQDHDLHIKLHLLFMKTPLVSTSPQVMGTFYAHIMEHVSQKARQSVIQQIEALVNQIQILAQAGGIDPMAAQQQIAQVQMEMQKPEELEKLVTIEQVPHPVPRSSRSCCLQATTRCPTRWCRSACRS